MRLVCAKHTLELERVQVPCYNGMNIEEQMKLLAMKRTTRSQLHDREGLWEGRLSDICQLMNKNLIRGLESGTRWHNTSKSYHSTLQINEAVGQRRFQCLPSEISRTCDIDDGQYSAFSRNVRGDLREVSRDHISWAKTSRGAVIGFNLLDQRNNDTRGANNPVKD